MLLFEGTRKPLSLESPAEGGSFAQRLDPDPGLLELEPDRIAGL